MLFYKFKNYEEFKKLFVREDGQRKNKVLLSTWKNIAFCKKYPQVLEMRGMSELLDFVHGTFIKQEHSGMVRGNDMFIMDVHWFSDKYRTDEFNGLCEDGDIKFIRYVRVADNRVFKAKFGRVLGGLMDLAPFGKEIPECIKLWYIEEMCRKWETHCSMRKLDFKYEFHYEKEDAFCDIYDDYKCQGTFHSCMQAGAGIRGTFYRDNVEDCAAAYLTNVETGKIIARCIVYEKAKDCETGEFVRLAERQYAIEDPSTRDGSLLVKHILVQELIKHDKIDGYKRVGAGCSCCHEFVSIDGQSWINRDFCIRMNLEVGDVMCYMDSFRYYDPETGTSYNDSRYDYQHELDTTDLEFNGGRNWDNWYEEYVSDGLVTVYSGHHEYQIAEGRLENGEWRYVESDGEYHWYEDVERCPECNEYFLTDYGCYSEITEEYYCCDSCRDDAEADYKEANWFWSDYDEEYYEHKNEICMVIDKDGNIQTMSVATFDMLCDGADSMGVECEFKVVKE